jgi:PHD/YefM family antitoxin component YafN of YafNO toxin-antitoxin module
MTLTLEQHQAIEQGRAVLLEINGKPCVLLSLKAYEQLEETDYNIPSLEEIDLLAAAVSDVISQSEIDEY